MTKPTKCHVRPAKTQISLDIGPVWSVVAVRMKKAWVLSYPLSAQRRLRSDWANAQAVVFAVRENHFVGFVMRQLKYCSLTLSAAESTLSRSPPWILHMSRASVQDNWLRNMNLKHFALEPNVVQPAGHRCPYPAMIIGYRLRPALASFEIFDSASIGITYYLASEQQRRWSMPFLFICDNQFVSCRASYESRLWF